MPYVKKKELAVFPYGDANRLATRIETHRRYSRSKVQFGEWLFSVVRIGRNESILDAGCGTGSFLASAARFLPAILVGVDISVQVLTRAKDQFPGTGRASATVAQADVEELPFKKSAFTMVMANFVLQYATNLRKAFGEFVRILRPEGRVVISTGSMTSYKEMLEIHNKILIETEGVKPQAVSRPRVFCLENGEETLKSYFSAVEPHVLPDALVFDSAEPFMRYYASDPVFIGTGGKPDYATDGAILRMRYDTMKARVEDEIRSKGKFVVTKLDGVFVASKPR